MQSDWSLAGLQLALSSETVGAIIPTLAHCNRRPGLGCSRQLVEVGEPGTTGTYSLQYLPTMAMWIAAGGGNNPGDYNNSELNRLLNAISVYPKVASCYTYENHVSAQLPTFWQPKYYCQTAVIAPTLRGVTPQDLNLTIYPQNWYVTK
ncbi:MAG TPA: hypothetical protein VMW47_04210 [Verrucomicrobiae bacterium]|nr:hypothetical protein [Verrucomicrobiae bacterium]